MWALRVWRRDFGRVSLIAAERNEWLAYHAWPVEDFDCAVACRGKDFSSGIGKSHLVRLRAAQLAALVHDQIFRVCHDAHAHINRHNHIIPPSNNNMLPSRTPRKKQTRITDRQLPHRHSLIMRPRTNPDIPKLNRPITPRRRQLPLPHGVPNNLLHAAHMAN